MAEDILDIANGAYGDPKPKLKDQDRVRLDSIVMKMQQNKESDENIRFVVEDFKKKYATLPEPSIGKVDFNKFMIQGVPVDQPFTSVREEQERQVKKAQEKAGAAEKEIKSAFDTNQDVVEGMIRRARMERTARETPVPTSDMPATSSQATIDRLIKPDIQPKDDIVTPQEIARVNDFNKKNEGGTRGFIAEVMSRKPELSKKLQKAVYDVDAINSVGNAEELRSRLPKIEKNSEEIAKGNLEYDPKSGRLIRPEGAIKSFLTGWKNKTKSFEDYEFFKNTQNNAAISSQLDFERQNQDPDEPMPVPKGFTGEIGSMVGGTPAKSLAAGAIASTLGTPQAGVIAGAAVGGREMAKLEYANTFRQTYYELIDQGEDHLQAVDKARALADQAAEVGAVVGAASGAIGARWGIRPLPKFALTGGVKQAAATLLRKEGAEFGKALSEGLAAGGLGAVGEGYKNELAQAAGINRDITQGMAEQIEMNLVFAAALGIAAKAGKGLNPKGYKTLLNLLKRADDNDINFSLSEMAEKGQLTPEQVETAQKEIAKYRDVDSKIPENVSEEARINIQEKINKRDQLEAKIESQDKAFHPELKEKVKILEEEINTLAKDKEKIDPELKKKTKAIQKAIDNKELTGPYATEALKDPDLFYKEIADQIYGKNSDGSVSLRPDAEVEARTQFGDEIVDAIKKEYEAATEPLVTAETDFFNDVKELYDSEGNQYIIRNPKNEHGDYVIQRRDGNNETITIPQDELVKRVNEGDLLLNKPLKIELDAVSIESPKEISMGETSRDSGEVVEGIPESESVTGKEGTREEGKVIGEEEISEEGPNWRFAEEVFEEPEKTGITHAQMDETAREFGLDTYDKDPETVAQWDEAATKRLQKPDALPNLFQKLRAGDAPDAVETRMMVQYMADLKAKIRKNPGSDELLTQLKRTKDLFNIAGRIQGKQLRARQGSVPIEETLPDFLLRQMETSRVGRLTEKQKEVNIKEYEAFEAAKTKYEAKIAKLEEANMKLKADKKIQKEKTETKPRKTREEYKKERGDILSQMRKDINKAAKGGEGLVATIPYLPQLKAAAPHVAKLVKSLVEEGIDNLPDLIKAVHKELKEIIEPLTERDVQDLIGGKYDEQKRTRSELTERLRDLKDEAKYLSKYQDLIDGIEPKGEEAKKKRNRQIEELKQKIKEENLTRVGAAKERMRKEITEIERQLREKDYSIPEKNEIELDQEAIELKDKLIKLRNERNIRLAQEEYAARSNWQKAADIGLIPFRELRTIWSSFDYSMPLRQGLIPTAAELVSNPKKAIGRGSDMVKASANPKFFERSVYDLKNSEEGKLMEACNVAISDPNNFSSKEEVFQSRYVEKIPIIGEYGIKGSERAAAFWLNSQRADLFMRGVKLMEDQGMTFKNSKEAYQNWGSIVNTLTGKGELIGNLKNASGFLSTLFFSPKLMASRLAIFNPMFHKKVPAPIRKMFYADIAKFVGLGISILGLAKLFGADTESDPRHSDFGKIKVGDTRWDMWGGFQQYIRLFSQLITMSKKSAGGKVVSLWEKNKEGERPLKDVAFTFLRSKSSPLLSTAVDIASGENIVGQEVTTKTELMKLLPIIGRDMASAIADEGVVGVAKNLPALLGVGVQTYNSNKSSSSSEKVERPKREKINRRTKND